MSHRVHMRVLPQVRQERPVSRASSSQMPLVSSARQRDLPQTSTLVLRSRRSQEQDLHTKSVPSSQAIPRPQVLALRHRRVSLLHSHRIRRARFSHRRLFLQRERVERGLQRRVYSHPAAVSTTRLRQGPHRVQLRVVEDRGQEWHAREAALRSRLALLPTLLVPDDSGHSDCACH